MTKKMFKFYIDFDSEYNDIINMVIHKKDASTLINRASQYGIPENIACDKTGFLLKHFLYNRYRIFAKELKQSLKFHQSFMSRNNSLVRQILESVFEHPIPTYKVRLNTQLGGISDWFGNNISINAFEYLKRFKERHMLLSLIWETTLSQTFIDIRKKYSKQRISDKKVWAISELTAIAIWKTEFSQNDWDGVNVGYPELLPYQKDILKLYTKRKNFNEYLDSVIKLFKTIKIK